MGLRGGLVLGGAEGLPWAEGPGLRYLLKTEPMGGILEVGFLTSPLSFRLGVLCTSSAFTNELRIHPQIMVSQWQAHGHGLSPHARTQTSSAPQATGPGAEG